MGKRGVGREDDWLDGEGVVGIKGGYNRAEERQSGMGKGKGSERGGRRHI
jgi:hypothetical protein